MIIWRLITEFGINNNLNPRIVAELRTMNKITFTLMVSVFTLIGLFYYGTSDWQNALAALSVGALLFIPLSFVLLDYRRYLNEVFIFTFYAMLLTLGLIMGNEANIHFGIMLIPVAVRIFLKGERETFLSLIASVIGLVLLLLSYKFFPPLMSHPFPFLTSLISSLTVVTVCAYLFKHYNDEVHYRNGVMLLQNKILKEKSQLIEKKNLALTDANQQVESTNQKMQTEIAERQKIEEKLREVNADLGQFAAMASHDLKEPLRTINSFCGLLQRSMKGTESKTEAEYLFYISDASKRMTGMLEDLISYARVGREINGSLKSVDLEKVLVVAENNLRIAILEKQAKVDSVQLPTVLGEFTHFLQLFQNLISNGIKFQREGVTPIIRITCEISENECLICIGDNGIGISQEYQEAVFEPFTRLHTRDKFEGSGIGLATCRKIVERYNGKIWVSSVVGEGTDFFIRLPLASFEMEVVETLLLEKVVS